jgi:site-specific DNA-cytosine methylase
VASRTFRILSLCSGVGGLDIGIRIAVPGAETVCYVERESYAATCLVARMADQTIHPAVIWDDIFTFNGLPWRGRVHCIAAGLPCQPYSVAGKQLGHADERALWPEFIRVVGEVQPFMVFIENVPPFLQHFRPVGNELSRLGFVVEEPLFVTAEECGGSHERERVFIMAHRACGGFRIMRQPSGRDGLITRGCANMADPAGARCEALPGERRQPDGGGKQMQLAHQVGAWPTPKAHEAHGEKYTPPHNAEALRGGKTDHTESVCEGRLD